MISNRNCFYTAAIYAHIYIYTTYIWKNSKSSADNSENRSLFLGTNIKYKLLNRDKMEFSRKKSTPEHDLPRKGSILCVSMGMLF